MADEDQRQIHHYPISDEDFYRLYTATPEQLRKAIDLTDEEAEAMAKRFFERFPEVKKWFKKETHD